MMLPYRGTLNGKEGFALDDKIKDQCTLIDEMMNLMSVVFHFPEKDVFLKYDHFHLRSNPLILFVTT